MLHLDKHLSTIIATYGVWTYLILFGIVFIETGLVVTPFLPGDSLMFASGTLASLGSLHIAWLAVVFALAAIAGDSANYWIGSYIGPRALTGEMWFLKKEYLDRTQQFFAKHGNKAVFLARFVPIVRTFAPFVAGVGTMEYRRFLTYNVLGAVLWMTLFTFGGYLFGDLSFVRNNFSLVILAIIIVSLIPMALEIWRSWRHQE